VYVCVCGCVFNGYVGGVMGNVICVVWLCVWGGGRGGCVFNGCVGGVVSTVLCVADFPRMQTLLLRKQLFVKKKKEKTMQAVKATPHIN